MSKQLVERQNLSPFDEFNFSPNCKRFLNWENFSRTKSYVVDSKMRLDEQHAIKWQRNKQIVLQEVNYLLHKDYFVSYFFFYASIICKIIHLHYY